MTQVDLTNCDREPIHIPGLIQPFGFLIALSSDWLVARASANTAIFLGVAPELLIGRPIVDVIGQDAVHAIRNRVSLLRGADGTERIFALPLAGRDACFDIAIYISGNGVVIEAEASQAEGSDGAGTIRSMMARLDQASTLEAFLREAARQVRALTGFDRVMVYRFAANGDGEVVAEAARNGIGSFLHLRYPHTDIPAQARELYRRNLFRIIADVAAPPVPVVPAIDESGAPLDLSLSVLRAVSPIHIEYLTNMGVGASLSISILVDGKLWGLFACHHYAPRCPGLERRSLAELYGQMFAMKLESIERRDAADYAARAGAVGERLLVQLAGNASLREDPAWLAETLGEAIPADGIGVSIDGHVALSGLAPEETDFIRLVRELNRTAAGRVYATDRIADLLPEAERWADRAAGMLALPISRSPRDYVVLFRQEIVRTVRWAGDPHQPKQYGSDSDRLSPRKSFASWSETVRGRAQPFTAMERRIAESLRATLIEVVLRMSDDAHAERQQAAERQELLIAELNHRVRNILSLIRGLVRQSRGAGTIDAFIGELDGRIHALARAHNQITKDNWGPAPLRGLIETEAAAYLGGMADRVGTDGPQVLLDPHAFSTLALVLHELMTNSAKYGGLSDSGRVHVSWSLDGGGGDLTLLWRESGGPPVAPPARQGFGTTIIRRSIPYDLGGEAHVDFLVTGLSARFVIPARHIGRRAPGAVARAATAPGETVAMPGDANTPLLSGEVLLVEDSLIIAMDAEDILLRLGAERVTTAGTVRQALDALDTMRPTAAILDINLGAETSLTIADRLHGLGIPYLFASGYGDQAQLPDTHAAVPILQKPYSSDGIAGGLRSVLG